MARAWLRARAASHGDFAPFAAACALTLAPSVAFASDFTPLLHMCVFASLVVMGALFWLASRLPKQRSDPEPSKPTPTRDPTYRTPAEIGTAAVAESPSPTPRPRILLRSLVWGTLIALCVPVPGLPAIMIFLAELFGPTGDLTDVLLSLLALIPMCSALVAARLWILGRNITP
jgi:hypothetical protein